MIFEGPSGTGKTSTALTIARTLFGDFYKSNFMEKNASDESGVGVVRNSIKTFCTMAPLSADFKILFLDECERISPAAQDSLKRIMEDFSGVTRFIYSCNDISKVIEPIRSRCAEFHFSPLRNEDIAKQIRIVAKAESIEIEEEAVTFLAELADGDMRKALNKLQVLASYGTSINKKLLSNYDKLKNPIVGILNSLTQGRFLESRNTCKDLLLQGYSERRIISDLHKAFIHNETIPPTVKGSAIIELCEADYRLTLGVSKGLQLDAVLLKILRCIKQDNET